MNWKRVPKEKSNQPAKGTYSDWKVDLSKEGFHQCVYCTITEHSFGGIRNFHVEHFKPKSVFPELLNQMIGMTIAHRTLILHFTLTLQRLIIRKFLK